MYYVLEGDVRIGDGSGWFTRGDAYNAAINLLHRRRANDGCSQRNGGVDPCGDHDPKSFDWCAAWRKYTQAIDAAFAAKDTPQLDTGTELVYGSGWHDSCVFISRTRNTDTGGYVKPGVGIGDLAVLTDHGTDTIEWRSVRLVKITLIDDRRRVRVRVRVTGGCHDGEKGAKWWVPIERVKPRQ